MRFKKIRFFSGLVSVSLLAFVSCGEERGVQGKQGMVVSVDQYASRIGIEILKEGGNAVDAAVAVGFALAVTYPSAGNIGGGGFMVIRFPDTGEAVAVDFRETAPKKGFPEMYLDEEGRFQKQRSSQGHLAVGVPGTVKGFDLALKKYGRLTWKEVLAPAIRLADQGFLLTESRADSFNRVRKATKDSEEFIKIFSKPEGSDFKEGDLFVQKDLAETLKLISDEGPDAFYKGRIGDQIVRDMEMFGGWISREDLAGYEAHIRKPIVGSYRGFEIISMPSPSSGGTVLVEMLNILEGYELGKKKRSAPATRHLIAEAMKFAYLDRARYLGDGDFIELPVDQLTSKDYAGRIRERIFLDRAVPSKDIGEDILTLEKGKNTTHYSVIDGDGLAVATTYTLNDGFGAKVVAKGTGILLNNEMSDFNVRPGYTDDQGFIGTEANLIRPHKRMLSSMTPTIVAKDGKAYLITGSPGGRTIINTVLNVVINVIDFKMDIQKAVDAGRMDHEWMPDVLRIERGSVSRRGLKALRAMGHNVRLSGRQGDAHSILVDPLTGTYTGAADKRSNGSAVGY